jgi:phosphate transport system substrate-binding protein
VSTFLQRVRRLSHPWWLAVPGLVLAGAGCQSAAPAASRNVVLTGSAVMAPLVRDLGRRFEAAHPGVRVDVQAVGTERGLADTRQGLADVGMAARALRPDETHLHAFPIARDGIGFLVHRTNPVPSLTDDQVVRVYTRAVGTWKQVGGPDQPITVISQGENRQGEPRSALAFFLGHFKLKPGQVRADVLINDTDQGVKAVAQRPAGIAYVSVGPAAAAVAAGEPVRLLPWAGVAAAPANVANGSYALVRPFQLVTRQPPDGLVREFIDFARSDAVRDLIEQHHQAPPGR